MLTTATGDMLQTTELNSQLPHHYRWHTTVHAAQLAHRYGVEVGISGDHRPRSRADSSV
jgi:hypothetical protein